MIEPPEGHNQVPHKVSKHYFMMMAEMAGHNFQHDEYCVMANWMLINIAVQDENNILHEASPPDPYNKIENDLTRHCRKLVR